MIFRLTDIWDNFAGQKFDCEKSGQSFGVPTVFHPSLCYFDADSMSQTSNLLILTEVLDRYSSLDREENELYLDILAEYLQSLN